ncbi:MAG: hypothetical protein R3E10_02850 [Gemmatimonadota bacterium]
MTRLLVAFIASALVLAACDGGTSPPVATTVQVTPSTASFSSVGETEQFSAQVLDQDGNPMSGVSVTWTSTDIGVANVGPSGLATSTGNGTAQIRATAQVQVSTGGSVSGAASVSVDQVPESLLKTAGDAQTGEVGEALPISPTVELKDALGTAVIGKAVTFEVVGGGGSVGTSTVLTGPTGRAATSWVLGGTVGAQLMRATVGTLSVDFTATGEVGILAVSTSALDRGRQTLPYAETLLAKGGNGGGYTWSLASGALPGGISLSASGTLTGTPSVAGTFTPTFRVQDGAGGSATRALTLTVCDAPLSLGVGAHMVVDASTLSTCGFYLPSSAGAGYRVGVTYPLASESSTSVAVNLQMRGDGVTTTSAAPQVSTTFAADAFAGPVLSASAPAVRGLERAVALSESTERFHLALRNQEERLVASLPRSGVKPAQGTPLRAAFDLAAAAQAAPDTVVLTVPTDASTCSLSSAKSNTAVKLGENQYVAIYQTVSQRTSAPVSQGSVNLMLSFYENYGREVIEKYFGGTTDINGDGLITVLVTPDIGEQVAAFVWSGDFFSNATNVCPASNERELIYFNASVINDMDDETSFQALATLVHEAKHVSSLYHRVANQPFHPSFIEEGTAEIAGEIATRLAWAATGGPAVTAKATRNDFVVGGQTDIRAENYGIFLRMARVTWYLAAQPNGLSASLTSQQNGIYGSGWLFHRFLGDAYGNAGSATLGDQTLFRMQNDSSTVSGFSGFTTFTGKSFVDLELEYAIAVTFGGTGVATARDFTTYDFRNVAELFRNPDPAGSFPWPVTRTCNGGPCPTGLDSSTTDNDDGVVHAAQFGNRTYAGSLGPGGIRVHEFESDGSGRGAEFDVTATSGVKVIIARVR